ncbi:SGS-domain-containing protein [Aspergillus heteromorphus CBS 117.55]|uniref:SGS-domain-containing protein n=1 Tax=Aspergillus heteromorphus CBS 117.55 TaxID=1448321 RepID=A0A317W100_9EURO|nr:SGS-domain-containing protein [Aspergillus heteromorphus CBS 117.55]PWY79569.1 SGS-domain-containing protein [Aspergillus heteromorphus CBS 117.55]
MNAATLGDAALSASSYPTAVLHFTTALIAHPRSPAYYTKRSTAFSRLKPPNYDAALRDADVAVLLALERGKRELVLAAQMRRGIALFQLGRWGDAAFVFGSVEAKVKDEKEEVKEVKKEQEGKKVVEKVRHEWYQSGESVVVTLYVKGVAKDKVSVMSTKVEIVLRKHSTGQKWSALETLPTDIKVSDRQSALGATPPATTTAATAAPTGPAYPTSSRHGVKDWDKLASDLTAKKKKSESKDKKKDGGEEGEDDDDDGNVSDHDGADPVDSFFKKLYADADPDTRRAMIKSYTESQGTSLSTNWDEVGQGPVKVQPPSKLCCLLL